MITEIADFAIHPEQHEAFAPVIQRAIAEVLSQARGFVSHELLACQETRGRYVLIVRWETLADHTEGFRGSEAFTQWRSRIGPFFARPPVVEHFDSV